MISPTSLRPSSSTGQQIKLDVTFVNISFVGSDALAKELGPVGAGVVIHRSFLSKDAAIPVVGRYQASLKASAPDAQPGFVSLEGYLVGRAIIRGVSRTSMGPYPAGPDRGRAKNRHFDLGGFNGSRLRPFRESGSDQVFLTVIQPDGSFKAVDRLESRNINTRGRKHEGKPWLQIATGRLR